MRRLASATPSVSREIRSRLIPPVARRVGPITETPALLREHAFAVVDVETTGFSPLNGDRIVEIAVVRLSADAVEEYETLVNPLRDVGPAHIHGLSAGDVASAPMFQEIVGDLLEIVCDAVMVAHNLKFDRDFLTAELSGAGVFLPAVPSICTLELSFRVAPGIANHRLATCCAAAGVPYYPDAHSAVEDARAEAELLRRYLLKSEAAGMDSLEALECNPIDFPSADWPHLTRTGRQTVRSATGTRAGIPYLARVVASLGTVNASEKTAPYMDLLDHVLEDSQVTQAEADALLETAENWGLTRSDVVSAHHSYLEAVVDAAAQDGRITSLERRDLEAVTRLLAIDSSVLHALLTRRLEDPG